jgi:hypothetical protein
MQINNLTNLLPEGAAILDKRAGTHWMTFMKGGAA